VSAFLNSANLRPTPPPETFAVLTRGTSVPDESRWVLSASTELQTKTVESAGSVFFQSLATATDRPLATSRGSGDAYERAASRVTIGLIQQRTFPGQATPDTSPRVEYGHCLIFGRASNTSGAH